MDRKKILIVSRSFYPLNSPRSFRATELAKEFARQKHKVTVLTHRENSIHTNFEKEHGVKIKDLGKPRLKPIQAKGKGIIYFLFRGLKRVANLLIEYPNIELVAMVSRALKQESGYDLLISIAVPHPIHWGVAKIWKKDSKNNPAQIWVADCGDPYMKQENDSFKKPFYFGWIEKWFCRKADYLSVPTPTSYKGYYKEFHKKIKVIPQGFRFEDYTFLQQVNKKEAIIKFGYGGSFIPKRRDPKEFLELLLKLEEKYTFEFHVYTKSSYYIEGYAKRSNSILIHEPVDRMTLMSIFSTFDFLVNFQNVGDKQTPSKLIDYLILDKPILNIETGNLDNVNVEAFLRGNFSKSLKIKNPGQYRIENIVSEFISLIS
jgi:glycosyltransferase involved in cell wall biosynthesis